jgi:hypothetical protein
MNGKDRLPYLFFSSTMHFLALRIVTFVFFNSALLVNVDDSRLSMTA